MGPGSQQAGIAHSFQKQPWDAVESEITDTQPLTHLYQGGSGGVGGCGKVGLIFAHKSFYKTLKAGPAERSTVHQIQMLYFKQAGRYTVGSTRKCFTES